MYKQIKVEHVNNGKVAPGTQCSICHGDIRSDYYRVSWLSGQMPVSDVECIHVGCRNIKGSGWGNMLAGAQIMQCSDVSKGDVLLQYSRQFDAYNVVVVEQIIVENDLTKMHVHFVDPLKNESRRQAGDDSMCVWEHDLSLTTMLFRPLGI